MKNTIRIISLLLIILISSCSEEDINENYEPSSDNFSSTSQDSKKDTLYIRGEKGKKIPIYRYDADYYSWGDILLNEEQIKILSDSMPSNQKSVATNNLNKRWANLIVHFKVANNFSNDQNLRTAINRIENIFPCIQFIELFGSQTASSYIQFVNTTNPDIGGLSKLGRQGGRQDIEINTTLSGVGTVIHEIGHALGLLHEHQSKFRGEFITINYDNIVEEFRPQFYSAQNQVINIGEFDFNSIMLYSSNAFSNGNGPSISRVDGSTYTRQNFNFSVGDIETISQIHGYDYVPDPLMADAQLSFNVISSNSSNYSDYEKSEYFITFYSDDQELILEENVTFEYEITKIEYGQNGFSQNVDRVNITLNPGQSTYSLGEFVTADVRYDQYGNVQGTGYERRIGLQKSCE